MAAVSGIYAIRHLATDRLYIGSAVSFSRRWSRHRHELRKNNHHSPALQAAYNKYGEAAFGYEIVEYVDDRTQLIAREQIWLDFFRPYYNVQTIAKSALGQKRTDAARAKMSAVQTGKIQSEETKLKRGAALKGHIVTEETRAKISAAHTGRKHTAETRAKISEVQRGRKQDPAFVARRVAAIRATYEAKKEAAQWQ